MSGLKDALAQKKAAFLAKADDDGSGEKGDKRPAAPMPTAPEPEPAPARQKPVKQAAAKPWDNANPRIKPQFTLRLPEELHMKLGYVAERSPQSMQQIAVEAVRAEVEKRLRALEKEGF